MSLDTAQASNGGTNDFATIPDRSVDAIANRVLTRDISTRSGSSLNVPKVAKTLHFTAHYQAGSGISSSTVSHNLGYVPLFEAFIDGSASSGYANPLPKTYVDSGAVSELIEARSFSDRFRVDITVSSTAPNFGTSFDTTITALLYEQQSSTSDGLQDVAVYLP